MVSGLIGSPGEQGTLIESGLDRDGIQPYRTYYYIFAPIDSVGNELKTTNYPSDNIERVHIEDDWWAYNQHLIRPSQSRQSRRWACPVADLNDAMDVEEFQLSGIALLATIVLNFILLPLLLKKRKRLKRDGSP